MIDKVLKFLKIHFSSVITLRDGTPVELSGTLETGVNAYLITPDGNIAMPDGEYCLSDETIILIKDGIVMDVLNTDVIPEESKLSEEVVEEPVVEPVVETVEEPVVETIVEPVVEEELQKGNPDVTGDEPETEEETPTQSGSTAVTEDLPKEEDMKTAELEIKVAELSSKIDDIMSKLTMMAEKLSAANPIIKKKDEYQPQFNQEVMDKVEMIKKLKKS
jgi:hypothetical protein